MWKVPSFTLLGWIVIFSFAGSVFGLYKAIASIVNAIKFVLA
jgi:hypothetical protein